MFEDIASTHLDADANDLWKLLQDRLCNGSDQRNLRVKLDTMQWNKGKEEISQFAHHLRATAVALPERISDQKLLDRFTQSLSERLRILALAVLGTFDEGHDRRPSQHS